MSVTNPKEFWKNKSKAKNWREYILPKRSDEEFDREGELEAERLYYFFDNSDLVVDYGCGIGRIAKYAAKRCKRIIGLDINEDFIKEARRINENKNANFYVTDKYKDSEIADFIYSLMVLQHNDEENRRKIIQHILGLLKPRGKTIIQFPKKESDYYVESPFVHKFSTDEVREYGKLFGSYEILEGSLINYGAAFNKNINHEYFLIARK